jgi:hypothetical protein
MVVLMFTVATPAQAQQTREEELAAKQAEKALKLHPYEPSPVERRLGVIARLRTAATRPVYPFIGSTFDGGGLAIGPGVRMLFGDTGMFDAHAAWSLRNYKVVDGRLKLPSMVNNRIGVELHANRLDAPTVAFYGTGNGSARSDRTNLFYRTTSVGVLGRVQAARFLAVGGGLDAIGMESGPGASGALPATASPAYRRSHVFAEFDSRTSAGYTTRGGLYRVDWSDYRQTNGEGHSFNRFDAEVRQFVPVLRENWVIALRALASTTQTSGGDDVPYILLPDLGGSHTLRGYPTWRFRDRNRLLVSGEYRWTAGQFVDMALFVDAGQVAPRFGDLDVRDFRKSYGIGMSFHTPLSTVMRVEIARTREGMGYGVSFSPSF